MSEEREGEDRYVPPFPGFASVAETARGRRRLLQELADKRRELGLSQTAVAAHMGTSQSTVARLETSADDVRLSTIERYAAALGQRVDWRLSDERPD